MKRAKKRPLPSTWNPLHGAYDPVLRAAKDPGQRRFDEDVKAGRASNTSGSMFSGEFMRNVKVDTGKDVL
jgi:hypothetical protein